MQKVYEEKMKNYKITIAYDGMDLQRCHYKPGATKNPAKSMNGPALENIKGQIMPTGGLGLIM